MDAGSGTSKAIGVSLLIAALLAAFVLTGSPASAHHLHIHSVKKQYVFYLIPGLSQDSFSVTMQQGAQAAAQQLGVKLVYQGSPYAFSPAAQIPYVDAAIAQHPDAILITPADETALIEPIRRAVQAGIPVIAVGTYITAPLTVTNVRSQNLLGGELAADALARSIHFRGEVASINAQLGNGSTDQRERGFVQELRRYRNIRYVGTEYDNHSMAVATSLTMSLLRRHPRLVGLFTLTGLAGEGAIGALQTMHRKRQVKLVEFDANPIQVSALRQGVVQALIAQDPRAIGNRAVRLAYRWVTDHRRGIRKLYYTSEAILTRKNVDDPAFSRYLYAGG